MRAGVEEAALVRCRALPEARRRVLFASWQAYGVDSFDEGAAAPSAETVRRTKARRFRIEGSVVLQGNARGMNSERARRPAVTAAMLGARPQCVRPWPRSPQRGPRHASRIGTFPLRFRRVSTFKPGANASSAFSIRTMSADDERRPAIRAAQKTARKAFADPGLFIFGRRDILLASTGRRRRIPPVPGIL